LHKQFLHYSTSQLVDRCLHNDTYAWEELVRRYANLVHSVPVRYGLTQMEVDDIGQDVFLALAQNLHQIDDPERLPAWLLTTTRRVTWRMIQKRRREQPIETSDLTSVTDGFDRSSLAQSRENNPVLGSRTPTMQEILDGWSHQEALQQGLERLDERCSNLLFLLFLEQEEPSYEEISELLSMPLGSIGPTRNRCLHKLRLILEGLGVEDIR
jgi:RNA polymerase sigma factor (sigma-70 family)